MPKYQAEVIELPQRPTDFNKQLGVIANGDDNNYPERVERIINNSSTAKSCAGLMQRFCKGRGFEGLNDKKVDRDKTLFDLLGHACRSYSFQNGFWVHVNWNAAFKITSAKIIPYGHARKGKEDDKKYSGKVLVYKDWSKAKTSDPIEIIDTFNPNQKVISAQVNSVGGWDKYKGQILFINPDPYTYPLAHIDSALNDAKSEFNASEYKSTSLESGFFGKTVAVTRPMISQQLSFPDSMLSEGQLKEKREEISERDSFRDTLKKFIGAKNASGILHMELDHEGDDLSKEVLFEKIESDIDDKMFEFTESSAAKNIRKAFRNAPKPLVEDADGGLFGNSGEVIRQMKLFFQENTEDDRLTIEKGFNKFMRYFQDFDMPEGGLKIKPLIDVNNQI